MSVRMYLVFILLVCVTNVSKNDAARILAMYPSPSISHQVVFRPLTNELVKRGHEVTVITADPQYEKGKAPANLTEIDVHELSYDFYRKHFLLTKITKGSNEDIFAQMEAFYDLMTKISEQQFLTEAVQTIINNKTKTFDLLLLEAWVSQPLLLSHIYKVPVISISSFGSDTSNLRTVGSPMHPLLHPTWMLQRVENLSIWDKIKQLKAHYYNMCFLQKNDKRVDEMFKRVYGPDVPTVDKLRDNVDMLMLNVHPIWEINRPAAPNVVYIGGIHHKTKKGLPEDLKKYLDSSKNGVIYVSFGTNVEPALLPPEKIQIMINVLSKLPYDVLWKWNKDELPGRTKNIKISKWLPQADLLNHPKIELFVTQGGLQSTDEAIAAGVPLVGIPMLGDQWYNVEQYVRLKIGEHVDMETINEAKFRTAILNILNNDMYRKNIKKLGNIYQDERESPLERAVWWVEYTLRHGGAKHLRSPSANISWTQYLELELVSYILFALFTFTVALTYVCYKIYSLVVKSRESLKIHKKKRPSASQTRRRRVKNKIG